MRAVGRRAAAQDSRRALRRAGSRGIAEQGLEPAHLKLLAACAVVDRVLLRQAADRDPRPIEPETIDWGIFRPQPYTYMSEEELFAELSNLLHEDDRNRIF